MADGMDVWLEEHKEALAECCVFIHLFYSYMFSFFETCFWSGRLCNIELSVVFRIKYKLSEWKTSLLKIYFFSPDLASSLCIQLSLVLRDTMSLLSHEAPEASFIISQIEQKAVPLIH